jgi:SHS2 domain-containing protein
MYAICYLKASMARHPRFEFLEHMADIKFVARGATPAAVFEAASLAVSQYVASGAKVKEKLITHISVSGSDYESLLYAYLDELLYLMDAEGFLVARSEVQIANMTATAILWGDATKEYTVQQVKAATYAEMYLKETMKGWEAQVVLDV